MSSYKPRTTILPFRGQVPVQWRAAYSRSAGQCKRFLTTTGKGSYPGRMSLMTLGWWTYPMTSSLLLASRGMSLTYPETSLTITDGLGWSGRIRGNLLGKTGVPEIVGDCTSRGR
ncbi:hypothetical protein AHAS_Ahas02G0172100 [Arachis hypogaea]